MRQGGPGRTRSIRVIGALLLLPGLAVAGDRDAPPLFYLQARGEICRWTVLDVRRQTRRHLGHTPRCPRTVALDLPRSRLIYAEGGDVFESTTRPAAFRRLPRPPAKGEIGMVWIDGEGLIRAAYLEEADERQLFSRGKAQYYRFQGKPILVGQEGNSSYFRGMAVSLRLNADGRWQQLAAQPSDCDPIGHCTGVILVQGQTVKPGTYAISSVDNTLPTSIEDASERLLSRSPGVARRVRKAYRMIDSPHEIFYHPFGRGYGILARVYYTEGEQLLYDPIHLCRRDCAEIVQLLPSSTEDALHDISTTGDHAVISRGSDKKSIVIVAGAGPVVRLPGATLATWIASPEKP